MYQGCTRDVPEKYQAVPDLYLICTLDVTQGHATRAKSRA